MKTVSSKLKNTVHRYCTLYCTNIVQYKTSEMTGTTAASCDHEQNFSEIYKITHTRHWPTKAFLPPAKPSHFLNYSLYYHFSLTIVQFDDVVLQQINRIFN